MKEKEHRLCLEDLGEAFRQRLEVLVVGTGYSGMMKVLCEVTENPGSASS